MHVSCFKSAHLLPQSANGGVGLLRHIEDVRAQQSPLTIARLPDLPICQGPQPSQQPKQAALA